VPPPAAWNLPGIAAQVMASWQRPFWGLPVPSPGEAQVLNWLVNYGYLRADAMDKCQVVPSIDGAIYAPGQWGDWMKTACASAPVPGCAQASAMLTTATVPFSIWLQNIAQKHAGVVLAERKPGVMGVSWDMLTSRFFAPDPDPTDANLGNLMPGVLVPPAVSLHARAYTAALRTIMAAREGKLGGAKDWFMVYAPGLENMAAGAGALPGVPGVALPKIPGLPGFSGADGSWPKCDPRWVARHSLGDVILPTTPPPFALSYPDGKGGWITIGTTNPPNPSNPPPGAPPLQKPTDKGPPAAVLGWANLVGIGLGIVVSGATIYYMTKRRKAA
jgi:hypothetical protein